MKKKVIGVLLATAMAFGLAACGNSAGGEAVKQETEKAEEAKAGTKEEKSGEVTTEHFGHLKQKIMTLRHLLPD